ncbi:hypothetical protein [Psychroserpens damuponensis]|uniref:hypothetical protein n=1 Tax=Psychroserpens damuponensis TaxID=943936 RepID=UPI000590289A|nr:hypothetical protein [Psychroserpens damuponensis]
MTTKTLIRSLLLMLTISIIISCNTSTKTTTTTDDSSPTTTTQTPSSYTSKMTKSDKKKYYDGSTVVYEIKYKPDGFKLRTASSQLIWKLKLYEDKIKISDNEENLNPYEIKITNKYEAKLVKDAIILARTSYDLDTKTQSIASKDDAQPKFYEGSYSVSYLVNRIPEIKADQQQIIIEELKAKGY